MILTLQQIMSRATEMAGGKTDMSPSDVSLWVNLAYDEVKSRSRYRGVEAIAYSSTTSGENAYNFPTDFDFSHNLTLLLPSGSTAASAVSEWKPLMKVSPDQVDRDGTGSGQPSYFVEYASWLELWPSPDSRYSLQLRYWAKAPAMVDSTDTPALDERWHPAILYKTVELLEAARGNQQAELVARNRYLSYADSTPNDNALRMQGRRGMSIAYKTGWGNQ